MEGDHNFTGLVGSKKIKGSQFAFLMVPLACFQSSWQEPSSKPHFIVCCCFKGLPKGVWDLILLIIVGYLQYMLFNNMIYLTFMQSFKTLPTKPLDVAVLLPTNSKMSNVVFLFLVNQHHSHFCIFATFCNSFLADYVVSDLL